ncbi:MULTISPECIES: DUF2188 domain-containing protein [Pseudomonas]|jgi:hypothetical protein|uniref:DUF2188 domain-containing protein n=2 Tax=Bacteria TaxID=2 RepID=UPI0009A4A5F8|nr:MULTISPECIES: DUF2188 domain-containing protein [Pseudomonas]AQY66565.1 DUF2188 domain-containing protein [Pseudomonas veronii]MBJ2177698.1 DUF2188 domain-containing protein [Pseudomonas veronii]MCI1739764.1 DUF2188 domain-containing protein [Pseudomonas veronii]MCT8960989.1 DUF2188 domain-containing protein [Pseudomonas veronii]MDY7553045.1 DUF2188 domain-containing protein [Pseudomonas sp. FG1]
MSAPTLKKLHLNGYDIVQVNFGPWRVCTAQDRLASFDSREQALAYAATLSVRKARGRPGSNDD